jgi:DNA-binding response OmpR family regulator
MSEKNRIIVVEDDNDFRDSMVEYLRLSGLDVIGVDSALEFYKMVALQKFAVVILDIGLPDQNGIILAEYIRKNSNMRIVMLTAQSSLESKIDAYRAGADIFIVKPVDFSELYASIARILGRIENNHTASHSEDHIALNLNKGNGWKLLRNEWSLFTPDGTEIRLTGKEFEFLERLASSAPEVVLRKELIDALTYENNENGNRALDALVHRLRVKNMTSGHRIPVKTVHSVGYCFTGQVTIQ